MTDPLGGAQSGTDSGAQSGAAGSQGTGDAGQAGAQSGAGQQGNGNAAGAQSGPTQADYDALKARLAAADQKRTEIEKQFTQLRDKDMPEMQKMQRDLAETTTQLTAATATIADLRIGNAFLTDNTHKWKNPQTALRLLDRSKITVDSDGNVNGLKDALAALAKSDAYLLEDTGSGDGQQQGQGQQTNLGTPPANAGVGAGASKPNMDAMQRRIPALKSRLG